MTRLDLAYMSFGVLLWIWKDYYICVVRVFSVQRLINLKVTPELTESSSTLAGWGLYIDVVSQLLGVLRVPRKLSLFPFLTGRDISLIRGNTGWFLWFNAFCLGGPST